jgi:hypothetical protein
MRSSPARVPERSAGRLVVAIFVLVSALFSGQFPPFANPNESSRWATVYAAVELATFATDRALPVVGDSEDKSSSNGRFYSNKAPGLALAAIPVYRALRAVLPPPAWPFAAIFVWTRFLVVTLVCAAALDRLRAALAERRVAGESLVVAAVAFGTPFLYYGRSFFSHAWTASLLYLAFELLRSGERASAHRRVGALVWLAGALAGLAAIAEYPVAIVAGFLLLRSGARGAWRRALVFAAGLAVPLALLLAYNYLCFGSPFVLSSAREAYPEYSRLAGKGLFGFGLPDPKVAFWYLFHPARGVVLFSPFLLWAVPGFWRWWRSRDERPDWAFCLAATVVFFVAMCAYPNWHGGWTLGDRYLLPVLFPVALAVSRALDSPRSRFAFAAAAVFSISVHALACSTWPHFPADVPWPPAAGSLWFLKHGWFAPSLLAPPPVAAGLALLGIGAALGVALIASGSARPGERTRLAGAAVIGLAAFAATLALAPAPPFSARLWRAAMLAKYSGRDPAATELSAVVESAPTPADKARALRIWKAYGPGDDGGGVPPSR